MKNSNKLTPKQRFLRQVQDYNDFIIQNDLDVDPIDINQEYDLSAFEPEDFAAEADMLAGRLKDRGLELKQNQDNGEFEGMELEGGMLSYEAVKNMSPEEYAEYEAKYLTPSPNEFKAVAEEPAKQETIAPTNNNNSGYGVITDSKTGKTLAEAGIHPDIARPSSVVRPANPNAFTSSRDLSPKLQELKKAQKIKRDPKLSTPTESKPINWGNVIANTFPVSIIKDSVNDAQDAYRSLQKIRQQSDQYGAGTVAQDAGKGLMRGLADMTGSVLNIDGIAENPAGNYAKESAKWWRDRLKIPNSESGRLGEAVGDSAVLGVAGGIVGRALGSAYKGMKYGAEDARKRITKLADDRARQLQQHDDKFDQPWAGAVNSGSRPTRRSLTGHRQVVYENLTKIPQSKNILKDSIGTTLKRGVERSLGQNAMMKKNDDELGRIWRQLDGQVNGLNKAKRIQKHRWDQLPQMGTKVGAAAGGGLGLSGGL